MSATAPGRARAAGLALAVLLGSLGGCGGDGPGPEPPTAAALTAQGWRAFERGSLEEAARRFTDALALDAEHTEAYVGQGWVALRRRDVDEASAAFGEALARDPGAPDAMAGAILVAAAEEDPAAVWSRGTGLLAAAPDYAFAHDATFTGSDVRWLLARAALDLGNYAGAAAQLDVLSPGHGLDPGSAGFLERAVALLEALRATV